MLYFAYGSNMRAEQMAWRCPKARPIGKAHLENYVFKINKVGAATIEKGLSFQDNHVQGVLWRCTKECITTLDVHEGIAKGHYRRQLIRVFYRGNYKTALTYIANNRHASMSPARGYLTDFVIKGGKEFDLDEDYITTLHQWQGNHILKKGRKRPLVKLSQYRKRQIGSLQS